MDVVCFCDGLSPLPVEEKAVKRLSHGACDGLFPLPVEEKAVSWTSYRHPGITRAHLKIDFSTYLTRKSNI